MQQIKISYKYSILILVVSSLIMTYGIWNTGLPLGDEAGYLSESLNYVQNGIYPANLYKLTYCFILKYITNDPIWAHYIFRFSNSLMSVFLLFLLLKSFKAIKNDFVILLICIFWGINNINMPYVQYGNINVFSLNIVLPALILIIRQISLARVLFLLVSLWWAACVRVEYLAPLLLFSIYFLCCFVKKRIQKEQFIAVKNPQYMIYGGLIVLFLIPFLLKRESGRSADQYLRLGLNQCYTVLYVKMNPEEQLNPMIEYKTITDDLFGESDSFISACLYNPGEVLKYLLINGILNSILLVPTLLQHHGILIPDFYGNTGEIIEISALLILCLFGTFLAFQSSNINLPAVMKKGIQQLNSQAKQVITSLLLFIFDSKRKNILFLFFLGMGSSVAVFLLIPHSRYWISCIPLLLLWGAWSISNIFEKMNKKIQLIVFIVLALIMSRPIFRGVGGNRGIIEKMRRHITDSNYTPVVIGDGAIALYAFSNDTVAKPLNSLTVKLFKERSFDFLIVDRFKKKSMFWTQKKAFLSHFEQFPEKYGYFYLGGDPDSNQLKVLAKLPAE